MLKNFWYACEFSSAITNTPKRITLLCQNFVLYRNSKGQVIALDDTCPHRGASLSLGRIEGDCIQCPYHGWQFQADGACVEIPANQPDVNIPKAAHVTVYPIQEKYDFVWIFLGDLPENERPPLPAFSEFEDPTWRVISSEFKWNTHYTRIVENTIDPAHTPFIHASTFGSGAAKDPKIPKHDVQLSDWGGQIMIMHPKQESKSFFWKYMSYAFKDFQGLKTMSGFYMPNITINYIGDKMILFSVHLPVDETNTLTKRILLRSILPYAWADSIFNAYSRKISLEDKPIVESQYPKMSPCTLTGTIYTPADALMLAYNKLRHQCLEKGWGIKSHQEDNSK
ncbi:aromatic ring-hydroxylating dioxygenase subunit alpha [Leptothoe spongobia]|uniref:Aromatic ring-hydroxylating dioxygenase subunit alpha n=1 Tax=Leptothoe spongobia TAU-MAC 1115 TaxID=1967444 RepID=A0A947DBG0_9CYAN|nr:aromatic ring-hydroxylating dioxygenase subunit alpha [Leptothoe spongobia]MBT9314072.1 aromatic ring-hydroxylating dioxygenase subunit alpha [Leptothoe spongobia TAU-MAC 1115]